VQLSEWQCLLANHRAARVYRRRRDRIESRRRARAEIEDAGALRMVEKVEVHLDDILDADEVAALLAGRITARAFEELDLGGCAILLNEVPNDRRHAPFVCLARTIDVEIAEPGHLRGALGQQASHILVEQELRVAIDVERRL